MSDQELNILEPSDGEGSAKLSGKISLKLTDEAIATTKSSKTTPVRKRISNKKNVALEDLRKNCAELRSTLIIKPRKPEWWERRVVEYAFSHPRVRSRLEKLMGSNIVRLTDREYMQKLQERIYEDHLELQQKRIKEREAEEVEREKRLILEGKLSVEEASKELLEHPVFKISQLTKKIIEEKRTKMKPVSAVVSSYYYGSAEEEGQMGGEAASVLGITAGRRGSDTSFTFSADQCFLEDDDVSQGFMFTQEQYEKMKYESPLVKELRKLETVDEMYALADEIIGPLKTMKRGQHCGRN